MTIVKKTPTLQLYFHCMKCLSGVTNKGRGTTFFITDCQHMMCKRCLPVNEQKCVVCKSECKIKSANDPAIVPLFTDFSEGRKHLKKVAIFRDAHDKAVCKALKEQIRKLKTKADRAGRSARKLRHEFESRRAPQYGPRSRGPSQVLSPQPPTSLGHLWTNNGPPQSAIQTYREDEPSSHHQKGQNRETQNIRFHQSDQRRDLNGRIIEQKLCDTTNRDRMSVSNKLREETRAAKNKEDRKHSDNYRRNGQTMDRHQFSKNTLRDGSRALYNEGVPNRKFSSYEATSKTQDFPLGVNSKLQREHSQMKTKDDRMGYNTSGIKRSIYFNKRTKRYDQHRQYGNDRKYYLHKNFDGQELPPNGDRSEHVLHKSDARDYLEKRPNEQTYSGRPRETKRDFRDHYMKPEHWTNRRGNMVHPAVKEIDHSRQGVNGPLYDRQHPLTLAHRGSYINDTGGVRQVNQPHKAYYRGGYEEIRKR